jgi:hypothetical protein
MPGGMASRIQQADFDSGVVILPGARCSERDLDPAAIFLEQRECKPECGGLPADPATEFAVTGLGAGPIERTPDIIDQMPVFAEPLSAFLGAPISFGLPQASQT